MYIVSLKGGWFLKKKKWLLTGLVLAAAISCCQTGHSGAKEENTKIQIQSSGAHAAGQYKEGKAIVLMQTKTESKTQVTKKLLQKQETKNWQIDRVLSFGRLRGQKGTQQTNAFGHVAVVSSEKYTTAQLIRQLKKQKGVVLAVPDYLCYAQEVAGDTYAGYQWGLQNTGQNTGKSSGYDLGVTAAWNDTRYIQAQNDEPVVAILDTGVDLTQEDLQGKIWENSYQGVLKGEHGYDFVNGDTDPQDDEGHGTHVAGIIAARRDNAKGTAGIEEGVKILPLKFLDADGTGSLEDALAALEYVYQAKQLGVNIVAVNNSWGSVADEDTQALFKILVDLLGQEGVLTVAATGNESLNLDQTAYIPAGVDSDYCISVAAANEQGDLASYSNYGKESVDVAAPGSDILSTVAGNCFNPTIYTDSQRRNLCQTVFDVQEEDFRKQCLVEPESYTYGSLEETELEGTAEITRGTGAGKAGEQGWQIKIHDAKAGDTLRLAFPYILREGTKDPAKQVYVSAMCRLTGSSTGDASGNTQADLTMLEAGATSGGAVMKDDTMNGVKVEETGDEWNHLYFSTESGIRSGSRRNVVFEVAVQKDGDYTLQIDDLAVSRSLTAKEQKNFGSYDYMSGTSMAAPFVCGSIALLHKIHPEYDVAALRQAVCHMVQKVPDAKLRGGNLTFSRLDHYQPEITGARIVDGNLQITGYFLGEQAGKIQIDGVDAAGRVLSWSQNTIILRDAPENNKTFACRIDNGEGEQEKTLYAYGASKDFTVADQSNSLLYEAGHLISDGQVMYYVTDTGDLYSYEETEEAKKGKLNGAWFLAGSLEDYTSEEDQTILEDMTLTQSRPDSAPVYLDGDIYMIVSNGAAYYSQRSLVAYHVESAAWSKVADLPQEDVYDRLEDFSLAVYNRRLYLLGGYNTVTKEASTLVRSLNPAAKKVSWRTEKDLPQGRYHATAVQTGSRLFLVMGGNGTADVPQTLIYNGNDWSVVPQTLTAVEKPTNTDGKTYYEAQTGICKKGLVIAGVNCRELGNVFTFSVSAGTWNYTASDTTYARYETEGSGTSVGDTFYMLCPSLGGFGELYGMTISSANVIVKDKSDSRRALMEGEGEYLPGQTITLQAYAVSGRYFIKYFLYNGKKYKKNKRLSVAAVKNFTVRAVTGSYVHRIRLKHKMTIHTGQKKHLHVRILPKDAARKVRWKSSKPQAVSVNQKGWIRGKKAAARVIITVQARDGSGKRAKCIVRCKG